MQKLIPHAPVEPFNGTRRYSRTNSSTIIAEARASLLRPSRPKTPALTPRKRIILEPLKTIQTNTTSKCQLLADLELLPNAVFDKFKNLYWFNSFDDQEEYSGDFKVLESLESAAYQSLAPRINALLLLLQKHKNPRKLYNISTQDPLILADQFIIDCLMEYSRTRMRFFSASSLDEMSIVIATISNMTASKENQKLFINCGLIEHLSLVLWTLIKEKNVKIPSFINQVLLTLRNLVTLGKDRFNKKYSFCGQSTTEILFLMYEGKSLQDELVFNTLRIHCKLSLSPELSLNENCNIFFKILDYYQDEITQHADIVTRVLFILGQMTMSPCQVHKVLNQHIDIIICIFDTYATSIPQETHVNQENYDLLTKCIRLISNGTLLAELGEYCSKMIEMEQLVNLLYTDDEELILNVCALIANLSFYVDPNSFLFDSFNRSFGIFAELLMHPNEEIVCQICRTIANMTRNTNMNMELFNKFRIAEICSTLLLGNRDVVFYCAGIILNLCKGVRTKAIQTLLSSNAIENLVDSLKEALEDKDVELVDLLSKSIEGICSKLPENEPFRINLEAEQKAKLLENPLDPDQINSLLEQADEFKVLLENHKEAKAYNFSQELRYSIEVKNAELPLKSLHKQLEDKILKNLHRMSLELDTPIIKCRTEQEIKDFWDNQEEQAHLPHDKFPSKDWNQTLPKICLYHDNDILDLLKSLSTPLHTNVQSYHDHNSIWSALSLQIQTATLDDMCIELRELHPKCKHIGNSDLGTDLAKINTFITDRIALGEEVIRKASSKMARQYAKQGIPGSVRPRLWKLAMKTDHLNDELQHDQSVIRHLRQKVAKYGLIIDKLIQMDVKLCQNHDNYFVFEDMLKEMLLYWTRDNWIRESLGLPDENYRIPCPNGVMPVWGISLYAMPVCYLYENPGDAYMLFRELYCRYFYNLHTIDVGRTSLIYQCLLMENLLKQADCRLYFYLSWNLGINPIDIAFKWIMYAYVGVLEIDQVLLLWDRIIGFDSLSLLAVTAAALFYIRRDQLLEASTRKEVEVSKFHKRIASWN